MKKIKVIKKEVSHSADYWANQKSEVAKFRSNWLKKGYELINITTLCEAKIGSSGWCNSLNEPDETCHHIQIRYRGETIANAEAGEIYPLSEDCLVFTLKTDGDFIVFKKAKIENSSNK